MKLTKYKITVENLTGFALVVYQDGLFKSFLTDVKPPFNNLQLNWILSKIPANEVMLAEQLVIKGKGKITLENLSAEPVIKGDGNDSFIALFCDLFKEKTNVNYKVSAADAGKVKYLALKREEWLRMLTTYFDSENFLFVNKWSIGNLVKYINELRVEAFGVVAQPKKKFPLPYDHLFFVKLDMAGQQEYWAYLRENGYVWTPNVGRNASGGKWVK